MGFTNHGEAANDVDLVHVSEVFHAHLGQGLVLQDTMVDDDAVDATKRLDSELRQLGGNLVDVSAYAPSKAPTPVFK